MKILMMVLMVGLMGCDGAAPIPNEDVYIVSGQSNARGCDWSYFEDLTGSKVIMLAVDGKDINYLISAAPEQIKLIGDIKPKALFFVHGESDAINKNEKYTEQVEEYRLLLGGLPLYISNVGYYREDLKITRPDSIFDMITSQVYAEVEVNDKWFLTFDDAKWFAQWGMLSWDGIHFNREGCELLMGAFVEQVHTKG